MTVSRISWLHISDRHYRTDTSEASRHLDKTMIDEIQAVCKNSDISLDFVFCTGDLAWGQDTRAGESMTKQYENVARLFDGIRTAAAKPLSHNQFFIVPGNHDVNRLRSTHIEQEWLFKQTQLAQIKEMVLKNGLEWQRYSERMADYKDFLKSHGYAHLLFDDPLLSYGTKVETDYASVGIVGLNSAWPCGSDTPRDGSSGLLACLRLQIERWWPTVENADCKICLVHHPKAWYHDAERNDAWDNLIYPRFDFSMHGHEHQDLFLDMAKHKSIAAGSWYDKSAENCFNIVCLDLDRKTGSIWTRQYTNRNGGGWIPFQVPGAGGPQGETRTFQLPSGVKASSRVFTPSKRTLPVKSQTHQAYEKATPQVVVFDLDGTILQLHQQNAPYSWAAIWSELGYDKSIQRFGYSMYEQRIINYKQWCDYCRNYFRLRRLTKDQLYGIAQRTCVLFPNIVECLNALKHRGIRTAVVSGGVDAFLHAMMPPSLFYFDDVYINRIEYDHNGIIDSIIPTSYDFEGKRNAIHEIARKYNILTSEMVFVGDAKNDLPVIGHVGKVIAIHGPGDLAAAADEVVKDGASLYKAITGAKLQKFR